MVNSKVRTFIEGQLEEKPKSRRETLKLWEQKGLLSKLGPASGAGRALLFYWVTKIGTSRNPDDPTTQDYYKLVEVNRNNGNKEYRWETRKW